MAFPIAMEIKIELQDRKPSTWRKLVVPIGLRYDQLHVLIQLAFGWQNMHLYQFYTEKDQDTLIVQEFDPELADNPFHQIAQRIAAESYVYPDLDAGPVVYEYDFGEDWLHKISLEKVLTAEELVHDEVALPSCVRGAGPIRREDSGSENEGNGERKAGYSKKTITAQLARWSGAGEQMILADDLGLRPEF